MSLQLVWRGFTQIEPRKSPRFQRPDLAERAVVNPLHGFPEAIGVAQAKARDDRQVLLARLLACRQNRAHPGGIDRDRLLGENVLAGVDRGPKVLGAKVRRLGQQYDVDAGVDQLLVGVEADEAALFRDIHFGGALGLFEQRGEA